MRHLAALFLALSLCFAPQTAQADEGGYRLANGIGLGGLIGGGAVGPAITLTSTFVALNGATNSAASGGTNNAGLFGGAVGIVVGAGITAIGPAVVVGSSFGGAMSVKDMGGSPSLAAGIVGAAGVGVQALGIVLLVNQSSRAAQGQIPNLGASTAMRLTGWFTGMIGGGIQMLNNSKHFRDNQSIGHIGRPKLQIAFVPTGNGAGLVGRF